MLEMLASTSALSPRFSRVVVSSIASLVLLGCLGQQRKSERPLPRTKAASQPRRYPPALDSAQLRQLRQQLQRASKPHRPSVEPALGQPGPLLWKHQDSPPLLTLSAFKDLREGTPKNETGHLVDVHDMLYARAPWPSITESGILRVRFETTRKIAGGSIYCGVVMPDDELAVPRWRTTKRVRAIKPTGASGENQFEARCKLSKLLRTKLDIAEMSPRGRGVVHFRLELLDPTHGTSRLYDGSVGFRCQKGNCSKPRRFSQLPTVLEGPLVDLPRPDGMTISWTTDVPTVGYVVAVDAARNQTRFGPSKVGLRHELALRGMAPNKRYRYHLFAIDGRGEVAEARSGAFRTAPAPASRARVVFAIACDSRAGVDAGEASFIGHNRRILRALLTQAYRRGAELIFFPGDLINGYTTSEVSFRQQLRAWKQTAQGVGAFLPIFEGMGNHEALLDAWSPGWAIDRADSKNSKSSETVFASEFVNPQNGPKAKPGAPPYAENVYSVDYGKLHFTILNSNYFHRSHPERKDHPGRKRGGYREGWLTRAQLTWLDADLAAARKRGARHLFVMTHEPAFPNGGHPKDAMWYHGKVPEVIERRNAFWRILVKHRVTATFYGDEHNFSRLLVDQRIDPSFTHPIWAIISGGAGAPYYAQDKGLPWSKFVSGFSGRQQVVIVEVTADDRVNASVIAEDGKVIDRFAMFRPNAKTKGN